MIGESPFDGFSRAPLRIGLAAVVALDLAWTAARLLKTLPSELSHPFAPRVLLAFGGNPWLVAPFVAVGMLATVLFARNARPIVSGIVAIGALAVLNESYAAVVGGPARNLFMSGALLAGWVFGLAYARELAKPGAVHEEAYAELGAAGVVAAVYVGAATSKLLAEGLGWVNVSTLRAIVTAQHTVDDASVLGAYAAAVRDSAWFGKALSAATLVAQLSAGAFWVNRRARYVSGALVLGFHLNVLLLAHILYLESILLVALFAFPWPRLFRGWARAREHDDVDATAARRTTTFATALVAIVALLAFVAPIDVYTSVHHDPHRTPAARARSR